MTITNRIVFEPCRVSLADETMVKYHAWFDALRLGFEDVNAHLSRRDTAATPVSREPATQERA